MKFKQATILMIVLFISIVPIPEVFGQSNTQQKQVRIGIRSESTATPLTSIYSKNGLQLGYYQGNEFLALENYSSSDQLLVRKDGYYLNLNGNYVEFEYDEERDNNNSNLHGPIHIEIGNSFQTYEEAKNFLESLPVLEFSPFVVSEDGWRVWLGLFKNTQEAEAAIQNIKSNDSNLELRIIQQSSKRIQVTDKTGKVILMYNSDTNEFHLKPMISKDSIGLVNVDGKNFRGSVYFKRFSDSDLTVINFIDIEEYLYGVLPKEMSGSWPLEALKAQAVSARNFTLERLNSHQKYGFDLCSTTHCQVYGGYDIEHPNSNNAVNETRGKSLTYNGKLVTTFYHANSGGRTENSENIWSFPMDYIKGVDDPYSVGQPNDKWTTSYTKEELEKVLVSKGIDIGQIINLAATDYSENGRVLKLEIMGSKDKIILEKDKIRNILGYNNIKSTWFELSNNGTVTILSGTSETPTITTLNSKFVTSNNGVSEVNNLNLHVTNGTKVTQTSIGSDKIIFTGKGWGHGLGMSQWGAKVMAEQGFGYEEILTHYYTGTKVE